MDAWRHRGSKQEAGGFEPLAFLRSHRLGFAMALSLALHGLLVALMGSNKSELVLDLSDDFTDFDIVELVDGSAKKRAFAVEQKGQGRSKAIAEDDPISQPPSGKRARSSRPNAGGNAKRVSKRSYDAKNTEPEASSSTPESKAPTTGSAQGSLLEMRGLPSVKTERRPGHLLHSKRALEAAIVAVPEPRLSSMIPEGSETGRKIGKYTFYPEADGLLTYRDPQKDFLAVLMPNGDMEFETRAPVLGGLCALGVCVQAGGLRSNKERKRKHLNRVRVRFAPVPLGIGGQFGSLRGVEKRKLDLLRATFEARFEMRIQTQHRLQKAALERLNGELRRILEGSSASDARRSILARAMELAVEDVGPQGKARGLRARLLMQEQRGALLMCKRILAFVKAHQKPAGRALFRASDAMKIYEHCERLR